MRKVILLTAFFATQFFGASAQTIPNAGMETWINYGAFSDPQLWFSSNMFTFFGTAASVTQSSDAKTGSSAAKIELAEMPDPSGGPSMFITGFLGNGDLTSSEGGSPFAYRPTEVRFWYKYFTSMGDESAMTMLLTKWNPAIGDRDIIGGADFDIYTSTSTYTEAVAQVFYNSSDTPDTVMIMFSVGVNATPTQGTYLLVDDVKFGFSTGVEEQMAVKTTVFPNPATEVINFNMSSAKDVLIEMYDMNGRLVRSEKTNQKNHLMVVSDLPKGLYVYQIIESAKGLQTSGKVSVN